MKHAGQKTLDLLEPLLERVRNFPQLKEKSRGVFYKKSKAHLHFHEDVLGIFADLQVNGDWQRLLLASSKDHEKLLTMIKKSIAHDAG
jgi:hypothetical protein